MKKLLLMLACVASLGMLYAQHHGPHQPHYPPHGHHYSNQYGNNHHGQYGNPLPGYTGRVAGPRFATMAEFSALKYEISQENFDNHRLRAFRDFAGQRLFLAAQLNEIAQLFDFDNHRINFAKGALAYCYDLDNYYQLVYSFDFDSYRRDLDHFINDNINNFVWAPQQYPTHPAPGYGHPQHCPTAPVYQPVPGYTGQIGAQLPMSDIEFNGILQLANAESFDSYRLAVIKNSIGGRGLSTGQAAILVRTFDFDRYRLDFAKYGFDRVYDIDNYYSVANEFDFGSYKRKLLDYIG